MNKFVEWIESNDKLKLLDEDLKLLKSIKFEDFDEIYENIPLDEINQDTKRKLENVFDAEIKQKELSALSLRNGDRLLAKNANSWFLRSSSEPKFKVLGYSKLVENDNPNLNDNSYKIRTRQIRVEFKDSSYFDDSSKKLGESLYEVIKSKKDSSGFELDKILNKKKVVVVDLGLSELPEQPKLIDDDLKLEDFNIASEGAYNNKTSKLPESESINRPTYTPTVTESQSLRPIGSIVSPTSIQEPVSLSGPTFEPTINTTTATSNATTDSEYFGRVQEGGKKNYSAKYSKYKNKYHQLKNSSKFI